MDPEQFTTQMGYITDSLRNATEASEERFDTIANYAVLQSIAMSNIVIADLLQELVTKEKGSYL